MQTELELDAARAAMVEAKDRLTEAQDALRAATTAWQVALWANEKRKRSAA